MGKNAYCAWASGCKTSFIKEAGYATLTSHTCNTRIISGNGLFVQLVKEKRKEYQVEQYHT